MKTTKRIVRIQKQLKDKQALIDGLTSVGFDRYVLRDMTVQQLQRIYYAHM